MANEHHERVALVIALVAIAGIGLFFLNNSPTGFVGGKSVSLTSNPAPVYWDGEPTPGGSSASCPLMVDLVGSAYGLGLGADLAGAYTASLTECQVELAADVSAQKAEAASNKKACADAGCSFGVDPKPKDESCKILYCYNIIANADGTFQSCGYDVTVAPDGTPTATGPPNCLPSPGPGPGNFTLDSDWQCTSVGAYDIFGYACKVAGTSSAK